MNTEQERAEFEAWYEKEYPNETAPLRHGSEYFHRWDNRLFRAFQAGRAALHSQDREDADLAELLREAAQIIDAIPPEHAPKNIRWPIVDELEGYAFKMHHASRVEGEGE